MFRDNCHVFNVIMIPFFVKLSRYFAILSPVFFFEYGSNAPPQSGIFRSCQLINKRIPFQVLHSEKNAISYSWCFYVASWAMLRPHAYVLPRILAKWAALKSKRKRLFTRSKKRPPAGVGPLIWTYCLFAFNIYIAAEQGGFSVTSCICSLSLFFLSCAWWLFFSVWGREFERGSKSGARELELRLSKMAHHPPAGSQTEERLSAGGSCNNSFNRR